MYWYAVVFFSIVCYVQVVFRDTKSMDFFQISFLETPWTNPQLIFEHGLQIHTCWLIFLVSIGGQGFFDKPEKELQTGEGKKLCGVK